VSDEIAFASIGELARRLRRRELDPPALLELFAARIERLGDTSKAFISLDLERARERAAAVGTDFQGRGPLAGIPYACKDLFDVQGIATTAGSRVLADNVATSDAAAIARMQRAGAIFIGKNNLHEFAYGATGENTFFGTPPNPWDSSRLAGGSSSGSAAALAYGLCAAALGTDTGGSVRAPAALCGLVGFKPTYGRIDTGGVIPYSWTLDHVGSFTRSAADAQFLFAALARNFRACETPSLKGLEVGIAESFFFEGCDSEILTAVQGLMRCLESAGAHLRTVAMPSMEYTRSVSLTVQMPEALSYHNRYLQTRGELYSPEFRAGLALGQCLLAEQYIRALRLIETYRRDMQQVFDRVDLLLTPATPVIAPEIGTVNVSVDGASEPVGNAITRYTSFFNMTGHPAITLPCGLHSAGLPIAAQLVGRHYGDEYLLETAALIEREFGFTLPHPPIDQPIPSIGPERD
jgi:aspartyl-tRNA(Asn)/glutamyl-tRNA(Gln) amidotransferase subunit A